MNHELPDVQTGFRKGRGAIDQIANICWITEKAREFQKKTSISALLTMPRPFTMYHNKLWKILKEMGISDHLTCLLRNLYAGQEATVRTGHGTRLVANQERSTPRLIYCHPACLTFMQSQFSSVAQLCLTLCNPMNSSIPGLPVHHQLPESTQTHVL